MQVSIMPTVQCIEMYEQAYSYYLLAMNERLEDRLANNKLARAEVHLIFIVKKTFKLDEKLIKIFVRI